jgi:hypothetical protein
VLALALALQLAPQPMSLPWGTVGRVYSGAHVHVGVRPAVYVDTNEVAIGATVQVTVRTL